MFLPASGQQKRVGYKVDYSYVSNALPSIFEVLLPKVLNFNFNTKKPKKFQKVARVPRRKACEMESILKDVWQAPQ